MLCARILSFALLCVLTACASFQRADTAAAAKTRMIGLSREDVLSCMGPPKKKASEGTITVWSYLSTDGSGASDSDTIKPITGYAHTTGSHSRQFCIVNVVMKDGVVTRVNYNGPSGDSFAPDEKCGYAVANCVGPGIE